MKLTQRLSLKLRLTLLFLALSLMAWFAASLVAWQQTTHKLDKLFDTQQMLFAKRLLTMDLDEIRAPERMREIPKKVKHGRLDDDALAFAIYSVEGKMLLNDGENGRADRVISRSGKTLYGQSIEGVGPGHPDPRAAHAASSAAVAHRQ